MNLSITKKLLLARRMHDLARENLNSPNDLSLAVGVNLLQDSIETFLLAVAEHVNAKIQSKTGFEQYLDLIDEKITPRTLPFRSRLLSLNKLRVNSKHNGLTPAASEVSGLSVVVREFFDEVSISILSTPFSSVSLIGLLRNGEPKDLLIDAERAFQSGDFEKCLFCCRKAIFVRIESRYDVFPYEANPDPRSIVHIFSRSRAPFHAKSGDYIKNSVKDPTDYIVLDHNHLEMHLMKTRMDPLTFWNVWRLTPEVYRQSANYPWIEKRDFAKLDPDGIIERSEYVLDATINLMIAADQNISASRTPPRKSYVADLTRDQVEIYEKASTTSSMIEKTPIGLTQVTVDFSVNALNGDEIFWHVSHYDEDHSLTGYILESEIVTP